MVRLLFLGQLEDQAGVPELSIPHADGLRLSELVTQLPERLSAALEDVRIRVAVNGVLVQDWQTRPSSMGMKWPSCRP